MFIPKIKKLNYSNEVFIERALPEKGTVSAMNGQLVEPFTRLGMAKVSYGILELTPELKLVKDKGDGSFFYKGKLIGTIGRTKVVAPFDGTLSYTPSKVVFKQEARDYWLLSGVWGSVVDVSRDRSVLLKTQVVDIHLCKCTKEDIQGELVVFPNPSELLQMQYLENFSKDIHGKIIYLGEFASLKLIKRAHELGAGGVLAAGVEAVSFEYAKENNLFLGVITGFGHAQLPMYIFNLLKEVSNRFVFLYGTKNSLRIPLPEISSDILVQSSLNNDVFKEVVSGLSVQLLQKPYYGWIGEVDRVEGTSIFVKFNNKKDIVEVTLPNILAIE